jgi:hypothetical protein
MKRLSGAKARDFLAAASRGRGQKFGNKKRLAPLIVDFSEATKAGMIVGVVLAVTRGVPHRDMWIVGWFSRMIEKKPAVLDANHGAGARQALFFAVLKSNGHGFGQSPPA